MSCVWDTLYVYAQQTKAKEINICYLRNFAITNIFQGIQKETAHNNLSQHKSQNTNEKKIKNKNKNAIDKMHKYPRKKKTQAQIQCSQYAKSQQKIFFKKNAYKPTKMPKK